MKKNVLYTVTKGNRPVFMPKGNVYDLGSWIDNQTSKMGTWLGGDKLMSDGKPSAAGSMLGAAGTIGGKMLSSVIGGDLHSGVGDAIGNVGGAIGGMVSKFNPMLGTMVSLGTGILGGGYNALLGTSVDTKKLAAVNQSIADNKNFVSNAGYYDDMVGPVAAMTDTKVYKGGLLNSSADENNAALKKELFDAIAFADRSQENNADNISKNLLNTQLAEWHANGGPLNPYGGALGLMQNDNYINAINNRSAAIMKANPFNTPSNAFGEGGGIHISPSKKGTFTAAASRHGMGVQKFASKVLANKDDYSPAMVKKANFARNAAKWHAFGGELGTNGTDWTNGLLFVDGGGTHQQNPLGGVPVGFDQNGVPNLVEEGETIWNDYVFSNRIKVPKAMFHTLGLGGTMKRGLTFADASKKLAKESEQRPNDPISMAGLDASLSKLAAVQEAERMKKRMREYVGLGNMAAYGGPVNRFKDGGQVDLNKVRQAFSQDGVNYFVIEDNGGVEVVEASDEDLKNYYSRYPNLGNYNIPIDGNGNVVFGKATYNVPPLLEEAFMSPNIPDRIDMRPLNDVDLRRVAIADSLPRQTSFYDFQNIKNDADSARREKNPYGIPDSEITSQQKIYNWLRENYLDKDDYELTKIANDIYNERVVIPNKQKHYNEAVQFVQKNTSGLSPNTVAILGNQLTDMVYPSNTGANSKKYISPGNNKPLYNNALNDLVPSFAFDKLVTDDQRQGAVEDYLKQWLDRGVSLDDALNLVYKNARPDTQLSLNERRARTQFLNGIRNKYANYAPQTPSPVQARQTYEGQNNSGTAGVATPNVTENQYQAEPANNAATTTSEGQQASAPKLPDTSVFNGPIDPYNLENMIMQAQNPAYAYRQPSNQTITTPRTGNYSGNSGRGVARESSGIIPYDYDNSRWSEFDYYNPQTRQYDEGYLNFAKNINQDWVNRILAGTYGDMSRYLSRNNGYKITPQEVGNLATDEKYSDMHKAMQAAYNDYQQGMDPVTGEIRQADNGEPRIMSAEEEAAAKTAQAKEPSNYPIPGGGETNPGVDFNGRTYSNKDERPKLDTRLRYAPVLGSAISVLNDMFNTPDYTYPDKLEAAAYAAGNAPVINPQPIGDYLRYSPFDRMFYANQLQANARATDRALGNTASPSAAAGMLANAYNTNNALGNLYRQAEEYNLAQRQQTADFNRKTNMFNSQMGLEAAMANAKNRMTARGQQMSGLAQVAALRDSIDKQYSASRSANLTNFFNNLGNIGRENFIFNQINSDPSRAYGYNTPWTGEVGYWPKFMEDQYQKWYDEQEKKKASQAAAATTGSTTATSGAYGGKLKRNKK